MIPRSAAEPTQSPVNDDGALSWGRLTARGGRVAAGLLCAFMIAVIMITNIN